MSAFSEWCRQVWSYWRTVVFGVGLNVVAVLQYGVDAGYISPIIPGPVRFPPLALVSVSLLLFLFASFLAFRDVRTERDGLLNPNPRQFDVALSGYWVTAQEIEEEARRSLQNEPMPSYALILRDCEIVNRSAHPVCLSFSLWVPDHPKKGSGKLILNLDQGSRTGRYRGIMEEGLRSPVRIGKHDAERGDLIFILDPETLHLHGGMDALAYLHATLVAEDVLSGVRRAFKPSTEYERMPMTGFDVEWKGPADAEPNVHDLYPSYT